MSPQSGLGVGRDSMAEPAPALEHRGIGYVGDVEAEPIALGSLQCGLGGIYADADLLRERLGLRGLSAGPGLHRVYLGIGARGEASELP